MARNHLVSNGHTIGDVMRKLQLTPINFFTFDEALKIFIHPAICMHLRMLLTLIGPPNATFCDLRLRILKACPTFCPILWNDHLTLDLDLIRR